MEEIPLAKDTDAEDVVWGLQTADTLWRRGEKIDALVWLRRAAQAAGDANDDDRALELARIAAELTEWMAQQADSIPADDEVSNLETRDEIDDIDVDADVEVSDVDVEADVAPTPPHANANAANYDSDEIPAVPTGPWAEPVAKAAPPPPRAPAPRPPPPPPQPESADADTDEGRPSATSVPPAETVHAGMFDPWADTSSQMGPPSGPARAAHAAQPSPQSAPQSHPASGPQFPTASPNVTEIVEEEEEVVTSVRPQSLSTPSDLSPISSSAIPIAPPMPVAPPPRPSRPNITTKPLAPAKPAPPPPLPPRAKPPIPKPPLPPPVIEEAPISLAPVSLADADLEIAPESDVAVPEIEAYVPPVEELGSVPPPKAPSTPPPPKAPSTPPPPKGPSTPPPPKAPSTPPPPPPPRAASVPAPRAPSIPTPRDPSIAPIPALNLDAVDAFTDLPDDARTAFAAAAKLHPLNEGEEIGTFALAYILDGSFDVSATMVDAPAVRLTTGAVLRARGSTEECVPMRLICSKGQGVVATWSDEAVEQAFHSIPWVEEDLRAAADRVQTLVGITIGPLGERLDVSIREEIVARLQMRPLAPAEIVVNIGEAVPGLLLVGIGELELVKDDKIIGVVGSGDFLFPTEVLGAGSAPATARAGKGGALILFGGRGIAQELLVTCPPLLEVFAGM